MIVEIPLKVVSESNTHEHWSKGYKRHKQQKSVVTLALFEHDVPQKLPVHVTMTRIGGRLMDEDNLVSAFKYVKDAIAEYFIPGKAPGRADDSTLITWSYSQEKKPTLKSKYEKFLWSDSFPTIRISFEWLAEALKSA